jgi:hypothetical protein
MTTRFLYQPHDGHTVCGVRAPPHREQVLRAGASRRQLLARRLRVFDFDFFFLGTATGLSDIFPAAWPPGCELW